MSSKDRFFDIIVWGATGFTGKLCARYFAQHYTDQPLLLPNKSENKEHEDPQNRSQNPRWAIAGRSLDKLELIKKECIKINPNCENLAIIIADIEDVSSLHKMIRQTRVILNAVGPFLLYGEPIVAACVQESTHYCDLTGESLFMKRIIDKYHLEAKKKKIAIVPACGFDCAPADLGTYFLANYIWEKTNQHVQTIKSTINFKMVPSGGTSLTALTMFENVSLSELLKHISNPYVLSDYFLSVILNGKKRKIDEDIKFFRFDKDWNFFIFFSPVAEACTRVVRRTISLLHQFDDKQKKEESKPRGISNPFTRFFNYQESMRQQGFFSGFFSFLFVIFLLSCLSIKFFRNIFKKYIVPKPGNGPSDKLRSTNYFRYDFIGITEHTQKKYYSYVSGSDPGYDEASKMVSETSLCLAFDRNEKYELQSGVITPTLAGGMKLIQRLQKNGMKFEIISKE